MDIGKLGLVVDATGAVSSLRSFDAALARTGAEGEAVAGRLKTTLSGVGTTLKSIGPLLAVGIAVGAFKKMIAETIDAQNAMAQLEAAVKSTGGAAGLTVRQLDDLSGALQRTSTYSDEAVQGAESILLTFNKIRGDQFIEATKAVVDLSTRMGGDLKGAALQVGKALQDPERGLTALRRAGVSFSASQIDVIKKLNETGQAAKAQQMILAELTKEFGGSAAAARGTLGGALTGLKNSFGDLFELTEANTKSTVRWVNALGGLLDKWKQFAERNVPRPDDPNAGKGILPTVTITGHYVTDEERIAAAKKAQADHAARLAEMERISAANAGIRADEEALSARIYGGMVDTFKRIGEAAKELRDTLRGGAMFATLADDIKASAAIAGESARKANEGFAKQAEQQKQIQENLIRSLQENFSRFFQDIFTKGMKSFRDLVSGIKDLFLRMIADLVAASLVKKVLAGFSGGILGSLVPGIAGAQGVGVGSIGQQAFGRAAGVGVAGLGIGYGVGQLTGSAAGGGVAGGLGGAAMGLAVAGPLGAVIGGLTGLAGGLLGGGAAAREHAAALKAAMEANKVAMGDFHSAATGTTGSLGDLIRQVHATAAALRAQTAAAMPHGGWGNSPAQNAAYAAAIAQIAADEAAYVARLAEEDRLKKQYFKEDLQVRLLRAQGHEAEANAMALKLQQEREYAAAVAAGADAQTLALLQTVQAAEVLKKAMDGLNTTVRNAPSGFKIESYINRFAEPRHGWFPTPPLGIPYNPGRPPMPYPKGGTTSGGTTVNIGTVTMALPPGMAPEKVGPAFMTFIRGVQAKTVGPNAPLADAMEYA